ncbi:hypothetical protein J4N46_06150 [Capnocytophaga sp. Marseille-Q4570]|uniref:Uncharacterized protein n=1 Tax=Capnocytophaga bilenii TaxID=2819369 RepID=A0ABS3PXG1_9FLAO|nr:hypothetical protein [Capnocytophaga bilenii]MBO1884001.1 hypothetical protein [Capnocytophaga bilenii]
MNFELGVKKRLSFPYIPLIFVIYSLRQLADFPSLILRLSFAYPSLILRLSFAEPSLKVWQILNCELGGI